MRLATSLCSLISSLSRSSKRPLRNLNNLSEYVARPCGDKERDRERGGERERGRERGRGKGQEREREGNREGKRERESLFRRLKCRGRTGVKYFTGTSELSQSTSESHSADIEI